MKRLNRFLAIVILVCATGGMVYTAAVIEQQKQEALEARLAAEQAAREAKAEALRAVQEAVRRENEEREARLAAEEAAKILENPAYDKDVDIVELQQTVNQDIYAWVYIPDSDIDYPVLQHPTNNTYYLDYNIDGTKGYPGCIYSENYNHKDFSDPVTVLYGHNMKNGSMFAGLHEYKDVEYLKSHPSIYIYTEKEILKYDVFAAYEYSNYHILLNHNFDSSEVLQRYLEKVYSYDGNFREAVFTEESRILTLSTCVANKGSRRYLVQGVLSESYEYLD